MQIKSIHPLVPVLLDIESQDAVSYERFAFIDMMGRKVYTIDKNPLAVEVGPEIAQAILEKLDERCKPKRAPQVPDHILTKIGTAASDGEERLESDAF